MPGSRLAGEHLKHERDIWRLQQDGLKTNYELKWKMCWTTDVLYFALLHECKFYHQSSAAWWRLEQTAAPSSLIFNFAALSLLPDARCLHLGGEGLSRGRRWLESYWFWCFLVRTVFLLFRLSKNFLNISFVSKCVRASSSLQISSHICKILVVLYFASGLQLCLVSTQSSQTH